MWRARLTTLGLGLACLLAAIYFGTHWHGASLVRQANELGRSRHWAEAARVASRVHEVPERAPALLAQARALLANAEYRAADHAFARTAAEDPNNWIVYRDWAPVLDRLGERKRAAATYARALGLNPRLKFAPVVARRLSGRRASR
jgi:Flp pilus assembly protein TadD